MAYYYFDSDDHIATVHNADVYLLANVGNYHDFNGEVIQTFKGFYLTADKTFTIGGNYGNDWNIYQKQSLTANLNNQIYAAVSFNGKGELNISSQIGAPDGKKHDDRNIKINAYHFLSNDKANTGTDGWQQYKASEGAIEDSFTINGVNITLKTGANVQYNDKYNFSGQIADINGIYAKNTLTAASHFNGYINVEGYHESIGMKDPSGNTKNTANDTSTIAAGLRGNDAVNFNGSFFGSIKANVHVHFQTAAGKSMQNNTIGSYGVFSQERITQDNVHAGTIFTTANKNYLDATIDDSTSNGNLSNNTITAAGLRAKEVTINQLDASFNSSHASGKKIEYIDKNAEFTWENLKVDGVTATDMTEKIDNAYVRDASGYKYYYIELPSGLKVEEGTRVEFTNGGVKGNGTVREIAVYTKNIDGTYSMQNINVILIDSGNYDSLSAFYTFQLYNEGKVLDADITSWTINKVVFSSTDVGNISAGQIVMNSNNPEDMSKNENIKYSTVHWECENKLSDGCYILNIDGEYVRIEASEVTFNGNRCSYTFTEEDAEIYKTIDLTSLNFNDNQIRGYYEFDYTTGAVSFNKSTSYNSGKFGFVTDSTDPNFIIDYSIKGAEDSKNGSLSNSNISLINGLTPKNINPKDNNSGLPSLLLYEYTTLEHEDFNIYITVDKDILIYSEANDNILKVTGDATPASNTMQNNIVQAVGIYGENNLTIKDFAAGSIIETYANDNEMYAVIGKGTITDNQINSIGIYGNTVNLNDFYGTIYVEGKNNYIDFPDDLNGTGIYTFAGIRATNLNVDRNLHGIITVNTSNNDTCHLVSKTIRNDQHGTVNDTKKASTHSDGIFANTMTVDGFIKSTITVNSDGGSWIASGIYVQGTLDAKGFAGDIKVYSSVVNAFGIYAESFKSALGYYYTFIGEDAGNDYGTNPGEKKIVVALDTFTVEGAIIMQGYSQQHAIATPDTANIYVDGLVFSSTYPVVVTDFTLDNLYYMSQTVDYVYLSYAVKTDFGNDVASGFKNDILQLGENATVFGIIALGGGNNDLTFDDNARFFGYVYHDTGKINLTYALNDEQARYAGEEYAIHTVNNECDATLSSNTTITINCNNIAEGEVYRILEYVGSADVTDLADTHWKTGALTISYMGESRLIYLNNYSGLGQIDGSNGESIYVKVNYDTDTHTLSVKALKDENAKEDPFFTPKTLTAVNIETKIEDMLDENGDVVKDANGNAVKVENEYVSLNTVNSLKTQDELAAMKEAFEHHISWRNDSEVNYVTYSKDETTYSSTASTTLYWMCDIADYKNSAYEIVYEIVDANGNAYSHALLRLNTVDGNKDAFNGTIEIDGNKKNPVTGRIYLVNADGKTFAEYQKEGSDPSTFVGAYYIMSYDIDNIPEGSTVKYQIRDYYGDGFEISEWVNASINTQKQEYPAFVEDVNSKYMVAVNPDDNTRRIGSSIALFTWRAVESNYAVDYYNVQYFSSTEDLSGNDLKRKAIFDAYAKASKQDGWQNGVHSYDENGKTITFDIYFGNGEIQIRELVSSIKFSDGTEENIYNYYNFVSKNVSGTELLASGLSNQSYIYWQVNATDILGTQNNYVEGGDFRIFLGDTEGPAFIDKTVLSYNQELEYAITSKEFTIKDFTWGGITADDEKSGVRYYILEASPKDKNQWTEVYHIDAHELDDIQKFNFNIAPGIYDIRVRPVDAAGNYGTPSDKITIYAVDNVKPECTLTETKANAWIIGEGDYMQQLGWNYTFSFNPAVDPTSENGTFQSTGINEYVIDIYYTDVNGARNSVDWELWGLTNDPETGELTYVRINGVTPRNNKFVPDSKYQGYQIRTGNMTYYELDTAGNPVYNEEFESFVYNNRKYFVSISVSDKIGNTTSIINKELNVSPEGGGGEGGSTGGSAPVGVFTDIKEAVVKATHNIIENTIPGSGEGSSETTQQIIGEITEATVTLSWTDTFTSDNGVYYLMQVSDSAFFDSNRTYTVLIVPSTMPDADVFTLYNSLSDKYNNLRIFVANASSTTSSSPSSGTENDENSSTTSSGSWRKGSNYYTTTIIMDNKNPTVPVGMFANKNQTYWQIKAVDGSGNETDFEAVQDLNFQSDLTNQKITETRTPAAPYNISVIAQIDNSREFISVNGAVLQKNDGNQELRFDILNTSTLLGYDYFIVEYSSNNGGNNGALAYYEIISENGISSPVTHCYNAFLVNNNGAILDEGDYTLTIKAYDSTGKYAQSEKYTFIQDLTRPVIPETSVGTSPNKINTTIKVAFDKPTDDDPRILTTVSWPAALDRYGIKGYVLSYRCAAINNQWQKVYINGTDLITENSCQITLFKDQTYDFAIYAIDNNGNYSEETVIEGVYISYKDIDEDSTGEDNPGYTPFSTGPIAIHNQLIGGSDTYDNIYVSTDNGINNAPGEIQISIDNLQKISGSGNSIIIDIYEDNGGDIKIGSYTFKLNAASQSSGITITHLLEHSGNNLRFEVTSGKADSIMQYDLYYNFNWFDITNDNNSIITSDQADFAEENQDSTSNPVSKYNAFWNPAQNDSLNYDVLPGHELQLATDARVGYADPSNFTKLHIGDNGLYTFNLNKESTQTNSALKLTIYQMLPGATALKTVKSITVAANKLYGTINDLNLAPGDYIIQVNSTGAAKGANVIYDLTVTSKADKYFDNINNEDDLFVNSTEADTIISITKDDIQEEYNFIFGTPDTAQTSKLSVADYDYVGIGDASDFRKITVSDAGVYNFAISKAYYLDKDRYGRIFGIDGALTMTIYELQDGKTALTKVNSITVKAKALAGELSAYLDKGEYYIEVKASAPQKTAVEYAVVMDYVNFGANGTETIYEAGYEYTINSTGLIYLNDTNSKESYEYIGFGENVNYLEVNLEKDGDYTFTVNRNQNTKGSDYSALKATLYTSNAAGTGFTAVKSITLKNSNYSSVFTLNNLAAGQYFIEITATDAAKGKYAEYNVSVNTAQTYETIPDTVANYVNAGTVAADTKIEVAEDGPKFYKFETGNMTGKYEFSGAVVNVYTLKTGAVNLTKVKLSSDTAYLDANTTYFVEVSPASSFEIISETVKDITDCVKDSDFSNLTADETIALNDEQTTGAFSSWVGYGDLESWRKLELENGGNFNLSILKDNEQNATAMTVTIYTMADNGISLKSVGSFTVKAGVAEAMKNFLLEAGDYYIQVKSTTAQGYSDFTLNINGDGTEDSFTAKADQEFNDTALTESVISDEVKGWVGYTDEYDYYNVSVDADGYYDFNFSNSDAAQLTLYIVNPDNSKLTAIASYTAKTNAVGDAIFQDKNGNGILLNDSSQYIAMVKSTNAKKGGNCDYDFSIFNYEDVQVFEFVIENGCSGKYEFKNLGADVSIKQFNEATGKLFDVKLTNDNIASLKEGTYFLTSATDIFSDVDIDTANKLITIA
ncbi:MAG: hypothetical protein IKB71_08265 [Lentisphaeria bacterium]|nr:hypothetical protein [Lentisphaeria bacterium]